MNYNDIFGGAKTVKNAMKGLPTTVSDINSGSTLSRKGTDPRQYTADNNLDNSGLNMKEGLDDLNAASSDIDGLQDGVENMPAANSPVLTKAIEATKLLFNMETPDHVVKKDPALDSPDMKDPQSNPNVKDPQGKTDKLSKESASPTKTQKKVDKKQDITKLKYEEAKDPPMTEAEKKGYKDNFKKPKDDKSVKESDVSKPPRRKSFAEWLLDKYIAHKKKQATSGLSDNEGGKPGNPDNQSVDNSRGLPSQQENIPGQNAPNTPLPDIKVDRRNVNSPNIMNPGIRNAQSPPASSPSPTRPGKTGIPSAQFPKMNKFKAPKIPKIG